VWGVVNARGGRSGHFITQLVAANGLLTASTGRSSESLAGVTVVIQHLLREVGLSPPT